MHLHKIVIVGVIAAAVTVATATAQLLTGVSQSNSGGGAPGPPLCNGSTDLSTTCGVLTFAAIGDL